MRRYTRHTPRWNGERGESLDIDGGGSNVAHDARQVGERRLTGRVHLDAVALGQADIGSVQQRDERSRHQSCSASFEDQASASQ